MAFSMFLVRVLWRRCLCHKSGVSWDPRKDTSIRSQCQEMVEMRFFWVAASSLPCSCCQSPICTRTVGKFSVKYVVHVWREDLHLVYWSLGCTYHRVLAVLLFFLAYFIVGIFVSSLPSSLYKAEYELKNKQNILPVSRGLSSLWVDFHIRSEQTPVPLSPPSFCWLKQEMWPNPTPVGWWNSLPLVSRSQDQWKTCLSSRWGGG